MKRIINQFIYLFFISIFVFTSCVNGVDSTAKQTYISIGSVVITDEINEASRTIVANNTADLTDFVLKGTPSGGSEEQLATAENTTKLSAARIPVTAGVWVFTLSAKLGEINFTGTASAEITDSNTTNNPKALFFVLSSNVQYGGLNITMTFTGAADKVVVSLEDESNSQVDTQDFTTFTSGGSNKHSFTYSRDANNTEERLANGTYFLNFDFYKIKGSEELKLNTSRNLIRIANGINTTASLSVTLNEAYEITYKFYVDGSEITDTTGISPVSGSLTSLYLKKTPTFTLPEMSKAGYTFDAWYKASDFTEENKITSIAQGTTGNLELYANFVTQGGNNANTPDGLAYVDLGLPSGTLWANMNVGATSVTDPGTNFYWNVDPSDENISTNYHESGDTLLATDDHATVTWGSDWVTPTSEQIQELYDNCYFEPVTSYNGVTINGYKVYLAKDASHTKLVSYNNAFGDISTYQKSGYSDSDPHIFLPAVDGGNEVWMWSSTYRGKPNTAYVADLFGFADQWGDIIETEQIGLVERPVRPVYAVPNDFVFVSGATISEPPAKFGSGGEFAYASTTAPVTVLSFYMCKHEVTQEEYEKFCFYGDSNSPNETTNKGEYPVYYISWYDAIVYCNLRSIAEHLTPVYSIKKSGETTEKSTIPSEWDGIRTSGSKYCGPDSNHSAWDWVASSPGYDSIDINPIADGYRLPTAVEWEYAARGGNGLTGTQTKYSGSSEIEDVSFDDYSIHKIMQKAPNTLEIYDMSGSVSEWLWDVAGEDYRAVSPLNEYIDNSSSASPYERDHGYNNYIGFRVVRNIPSNP